MTSKMTTMQCANRLTRVLSKNIAGAISIAFVMAALVLLATGCAAQKADSNSVAEGWESWEIEINGKQLTLPCTLADIEESGLSVIAGTPMELEGGSYWVMWQAVKPGEETGFVSGSAYCDSASPTMEQIEVKWCTASVTYYENTPFDVGLPGNIAWGQSTIDDAIAAYGEPDESLPIEKDGVTSYFWYIDPEVKDDSGYLQLGAYNDTGVIEHISLGCPESKNP